MDLQGIGLFGPRLYRVQSKFIELCKLQIEMHVFLREKGSWYSTELFIFRKSFPCDSAVSSSQSNPQFVGKKNRMCMHVQKMEFKKSKTLIHFPCLIDFNKHFQLGEKEPGELIAMTCSRFIDRCGSRQHGFSSQSVYSSVLSFSLSFLHFILFSHSNVLRI